jgi:hypothetical protein
MHTYVGENRIVTVSGGSIPETEQQRLGIYEVGDGPRCGFLIKVDGKTLDCFATQRSIRFIYNNEVREMTYAEFFARLGFK